MPPLQQPDRRETQQQRSTEYQVCYLPLFWDDLDKAVHYVADVLNAPETAERIVNEVEAAILHHAKDPTAAAIYKTTRTRPLPYYWFAVGNYMVFYAIVGKTMEVRRFLYGARDLTKIIP